MGVTLKKIAELAGVSTGTVDRALHDRGRVDPKVSQRIKELAAELGYRPNSVAKGLTIRNKNLKITVILHVQNLNTYFQDVVTGIEKCKDEIADFGISVEIKLCPDFNAEAQLALIDQAAAEGVHAIAIVPINSPLIRDRLNELYDRNFPVVFLTNIISGANYLSFVGCNYTKVGQITAGLLNMLQPVRGKLLLFSPSLQMMGHIMRAEGLKAQLEKEYPQIELQHIYEMTGDDIRDYQITSAALAAYPDTNLFVCTGANSHGNLQAIGEAGYYKKAQIICYDYSNEIGDEIKNRNITASITQCPQEQGYHAVRILFDYLTASQKPKFKDHYILTRIIMKENLEEIELIREQYRPAGG